MIPHDSEKLLGIATPETHTKQRWKVSEQQLAR